MFKELKDLDDRSIANHIVDAWTDLEDDDYSIEVADLVANIITDENLRTTVNPDLTRRIEKLVNDSWTGEEFTNPFVLFTSTHGYYDGKFITMPENIDECVGIMSTQEYFRVTQLIANKREKYKMTKSKTSSIDINSSKLLETFKSASKEATKRNSVRLVTKATLKGGKALIKASGVAPKKLEFITDNMETKEGEMVLKGLVGFLSVFLPQLEEDEVFQLLAEEARNQSIEDGQQLLGAVLEKHLLPFIVPVLDGLRKDPKIQALIKERAAK